jgi:type IV secretion system protein VirD4
MRNNTTIAHRGILDGPSDYAIAALITLAVLGLLGTYATGELAGLITNLTLPTVRFGASIGILAALPHHLNDPKQAWPTAVRAELPGPIGFAVAGILVISLTAVAVAVLLRRLSRIRQVRGFASRAHLTASLTEKAVLARGPVVRPSLKGTTYQLEDVGVRAGHTVPGRTPVALSCENSVLMLAAPRQGKTSQVVIPWLHSWRGPALVTSVRPDVLESTAMLRRTRGPVLVMAPTGMISWPDMLRWSPTSGCEDFDKARQRAEVMVTVGKSDQSQAAASDNSAFFGMAATNLLAGWLHAAAISDKSMDDVLRWALDERLDEPLHILAGNPLAAPGTSGMLDNLYRAPAETTRSNLWTTVQTAIAPLLSPTVRDTFTPAQGHGVDLTSFLRHNGTIYLLVSDKQSVGLAPLISAFVDELIETAKHLADRSPGGRLDPPLAVLGDEIANVSPLPEMPSLMSYAGGSGIFVVLVLQNMAQAIGRWGKDGAAMIWGAATVKLALGGLSGDELDDLSKLAGTYREALTTHQHGTGGYSMQTTLHDRHTLTAEEIRTLSEARREALLIHATTPAVKVRMRRHYEGPHADAFTQAVIDARAIIAGQVTREDRAA